MTAPFPDTAECLARSAMFESLSAEDRGGIARSIRPMTFRGGGTIFVRGDEPDGLYLLRSGAVSLTFTTSDSRDVSLSLATIGAVSGEISALDGGLRSAEARAMTDVDCLFLPLDDVHAALDANPRFAKATIHFLCARLRESDQKLEVLVLQSTEGRLARFLLSAVEARTREPGKGKMPVTLSSSQSEIGLLIGVPRANVAAALALLENEQAVRLSGDDIVCDPSMLLRIIRQGWD